MKNKILTILTTAVVLAGCSKTIKLSDEDAWHIRSAPVKIVENNKITETRNATSGAKNGILGVIVVSALNSAAGTYDEMAKAPVSRFDPQLAMRKRITKHLKAARGMKFGGKVKGPYTKPNASEEKRAKALVKFAKSERFKGYYLDISPKYNHARLNGAGWFAILHQAFSARALLVSAEDGTIAAAATCQINKHTDLTEFSEAGQENADRIAREMGEACADYIIQKIF